MLAIHTTWGTLTSRRAIYVPFGRLPDLHEELKRAGVDLALCTRSPGRRVFDADKIQLWASAGARQTAIEKMGLLPLIPERRCSHMLLEGRCSREHFPTSYTPIA